MKTCKHCAAEFPTTSIAAHTKWCSANPARATQLEGLAKARRDRAQQMEAARRTGAKPPSGNQHSNGVQPVSEATRKKISEAVRSRGSASVGTRAKISSSRQKWLSENPEKHPWKNADKFRSAPCQELKARLKAAGLDFQEEHQPLRDRFFSLDIAFPEIKLALEVNGNQHYADLTNETLMPYYQERHDALVAAGWAVVEIRYLNVYRPSFVAGLVTTIRAVLVAHSG